ncbi:MAG: ribonuclease Z [Desulfobacterales bacterium]|uniref:Ribonuclease Z n=1 Tax=Candidatus Desulfatibia vada TaxID=2841696 RepID=A0A8J6P4A1_9BACT|nr:ribonuclease Z [Candidatus Desulfatibia vada]
MRPSFYPRLVNGPFDDPGLFVPFLLEKRAVMFDLGDIHALSPRDIHKTSHIFITHTHMDHFIGFDRLLRLFLGRDQSICMYGPKGFIQNVEGKLAGYSWNLVKHYGYQFSLQVSEVHPDHLITKEYLCRNRFLPAQKDIKQPFNGILHQEAALSVCAELLDHDIPCLGFRLQEGFHINIMKERVAKLGLETGPWLNEFKQALFNSQDPHSEFTVKCGENLSIQKRFVVGELAKQIALITPGQIVAYIADVAYSKSNVEKIVKLAKDADHLFIEAAFLEDDRDIAGEKGHLTAWQAGRIAGMARVKQFTPFHFSPRYTGREHLLEKEARQAYEKEIKKSLANT